MNEFFDCRLCFLFDTKVKLDFFNIQDLKLNDVTRIKNHENNTLIIIDSDCKINNKLNMIHDHNSENYSNFNIINDSKSNNDFNIACDNDSNRDNNMSLRYNINNNCNTDDECIAEFKETQSFLY